MKKRLLVLLSVLVILSAFTITASADMGPKPSLDITVETPPESLYYLDLLLPGAQDEHCSSSLDESKYDEIMFNTLKNYSSPDWHTACVQGSRGAPLWGDIKSDNNYFHYGYFGLPGVGNKYKIIMVFSDGTYVESGEFTRKIYQESITIKFSKETNSITLVKEQSKILMFIKQFLPTLAITLIVEFLFLLIFKIPIKENLILFFVVNFITNIGLNLFLFTTNIKSGSLSSMIIFIPIEIAVLILEIISYAVLMKSRNKGISIAYAVTANLVSAALSFLFLRIPGIL